MDPKHILVYVTAPSMADGRKVAQILVSQKLAAGVNILPGVTSIYTWQGEINEDTEVLLIIKTRADLFDALSVAVDKAHPYDLPAIIAVSLSAGTPGYLHWIDEVTRKV